MKEKQLKATVTIAENQKLYEKQYERMEKEKS